MSILSKSTAYLFLSLLVAGCGDDRRSTDRITSEKCKSDPASCMTSEPPPTGALSGFCHEVPGSCGRRDVRGELCTEQNGGTCGAGRWCGELGHCEGQVCQLSNPLSCPGELYCTEGICREAFGNTYAFTRFRIKVPERKPNGECWDTINNRPGGECEAPDLIVELRVNGREGGGTSSEKKDHYEAVFYERIEARLAQDDNLQLLVLDRERHSSEDEVVLECTIESLTAEKLRRLDFDCKGSASLEYDVIAREY